MKQIIFIGLFLIGLAVTTPGSADSDFWIAKDGNKTVFVANATLELHVTYTTTNKSTVMKTLPISEKGDDPFTVTGKSVSKTGLNIMMRNADGSVMVQLMFSTDTKNYMLTEVMVMFSNYNKTFENAKYTGSVNASFQNGSALKTPVAHSYVCSLSTEVELMSTTKEFTWINLDIVQLEAFTNTTEFSPKSPCFTDQTQPSATNNTWDFSQEKNLCARLQTTGSVEVMYQQVSGKTRTAMIPLPKSGKTSGICGNTTVTASLELDGSDVVLFMSFQKSTNSSKGDSETYQLGGITLTFKNTSPYFPNLKKSDAEIMNKSLAIHPVKVGQSLQCDVTQTQMVTKDLSIKMTDTKWIVFSVPKSGFGEATECPEMVTTTQMPPTTPQPDPAEPNAYEWMAMYSNNTCFMAMAGIQFKGVYKKSGQSEVVDTFFDFNNASDVSSTNCSKDVYMVTFNQKERKQMITLTFGRMKDSYALTKVQLTFTVLDSTFVNSTNLNQIVSVSSPSNMELLKTPINSSYSCSIETQVKLSGNESKSNVSDLYLRITKISNLEAFPSSEENKTTATKCFSDQPHSNATMGDWTVKVSPNNTCARVQSKMMLSVGYLYVDQKMHFANIPVDGEKVKVLHSKCDANTTMITLDLYRDKSMNLTLTYTKKSSQDKLRAETWNYFLNNISLEYMTTNPYFPNHYDYPGIVNIFPNSSLNEYQTPVGSSFRCDLSQDLPIPGTSDGKSLTITFVSTQWEAFGMKQNGSFHDARYCSQEQSTTVPMTTKPVTPHPINPKDPHVEMFQVMDMNNNKTTCFLADVGIQLRTTFFAKNSSEKTEVGFNFMKNITTATASCNANLSEITLFNENTQQTIMMTFTRNSAVNETYLTSVRVEYNVSSHNFPNLNTTANPKKVNVTLSGIELFRAMKESSYNCSQETDILVDHQNQIVVRILGVRIQAFDIKDGKYSKVSQCLADTMKTKTGAVGDWMVKDGNKTCARYQFASVVNITYPTIMGENATTVFILDNSTTTSYGVCSNVSSFSLVIDGNTFTFLFNKTDESGGVFNYHMMDFHVQYSVKSRYFPNHAYDSDGLVDLGNSTIKLFEASSDHSYTCSAETSITFNTTNTISFKNVKVQPFGVTASGGFSKAEDCASDKDLSPVIPIVVGAVLAFLVVLVIIAYVIGRKRARSVEYETI